MNEIRFTTRDGDTHVITKICDGCGKTLPFSHVCHDCMCEKSFDLCKSCELAHAKDKCPPGYGCNAAAKVKAEPKAKKEIPRKEWRCPKCDSKPIPYMVKDGGSAQCSDKECNKLFHYCSFFCDYSLESPMNCKCWKYRKVPKHKRRAFKRFSLTRKNELLDGIMHDILQKISDEPPKDQKRYDGQVKELISGVEFLQEVLDAIHSC